MIEVERLTKTYGATRAIHDVSFSVAKGEVVGFLGLNGAGKSTTMRILAGALGATSGHARIGGLDVLDDPRGVKALLGYLPERPPVYDDMTVRAYLTFCARIKHVSDVASAVDRAMQRVGLTEVGHRYVDQLSKGYRQRVGIAQAIVHEPRVLILDEPASGLDPAQRIEIRNLVRELAAGDTTVVLSTHVLPEVEAVCDRVIIIDRGEIKRTATLDELRSTGVSLEVARPSQDLLDALGAVEGVREVVNRGGGAIEVRGEHDVREAIAKVAVQAGLLRLAPLAGLEDVFLHAIAQEAA